ncbi:hypothetical protein [Massilia aerilata]|uniref:Uncharacterized protein n=1 Tax=Massilia aerilata TaxID=453817 RepID=A0ABW0RY02_9BURK
MTTFLRRLLPLSVFLLVLAACGGGGGGGAAPGGSTPPVSPPVGTPPAAPPPLPTANSITLQSEPGDAIGQGKSYQYSASNAVITVTAVKNRLVVEVKGDEQWTGVFQTGGNAAELKIGEYTAVPLYRDNMDAGASGLTWWGNGRTCTSSTGSIIIDNVAYANGFLQAITLRFQRTCNGAAAALRGTVNYTVNDKSTAPLPASPAGDLWRPPASVAASPGNYAYFESAPGDYVGLGKTWLFDRRSALVTVDGAGGHLNIRVAGDDIWRAELEGVDAMNRLAPGYYADVKGARFHNPVKGGMSWTGAGRGCSTSTGWYVVDAIEYEPSGVVKRLDLRFEQHCEGRAAPLHGAIHYDNTPPAGNAAVSAAGSWRAPAAALPATDNFLYIESDAGEPLARGRTELQTSANTAFEVVGNGNLVEIAGKGNHLWNIRFQTPSSISQIVPGNYTSVAAWPMNTSTEGVLNASVDSSTCSTQRGWVTVDSAIYSGGKLAALELRFEILCTVGVSSPQGLLHGHLRWRADQPAAFPGPAAVPELFWRPSAAMPAGTYVYLSSDRSDFVGNGDALFTPLDAAITLTEKDGKLDLTVNGDTRWQASFQAMSNAGAILPGYYAGLGQGPWKPARGGFSWFGDGRGCNTSSSGVVVDKAAYVGGQLSELTMRFEQHCEDAPGALRGEIHWLASDTRQPAGPRAAVPATLWKAPAGALPASGNYLYIESPAGEPVGGGKSYLLTPANATLRLQAADGGPLGSGGYLSFDADSGNWASGQFKFDFQAMRSVAQLQPGFYDHLLRYGTHNTAFGGLSVSSHALGCNSSFGWMVLDKVSYTNGRLGAVHGRFEQYCEGSAVPLHGEFNWEG